MSLARTIIYEDLSSLQNKLAAAPALDEIDEYGYTPLIQAAIVNDAQKAQALLEAGASVDFTDLTGRTALHWASDNHNVELVALLLQHGADPNAYTLGAQPVLVMPLLRGHDRIKQLLTRHGASLAFAKDFVNAKELGHIFSLQGRVDIVTDEPAFLEVPLEGFYVEFSTALVLESLLEFRHHFKGREFQAYFAPLQVVIKAMEQANVLLQYQHYLIDKRQHQGRIQKALSIQPLLLPVCYEGHAISLVVSGRFVIRVDRGHFGRANGTVMVYEMPNKKRWSFSMAQQLMYTRLAEDFVNEGLGVHLQLSLVTTFDLSAQSSGNCAWANIEGGVFSLLLAIFYGECEDWGQSSEKAMVFYEEWMAFESHRALHFCVNSYEGSSRPRQVSKASLLAAILFQHLRSETPLGQQWSERILPILLEPDFHYILRAYLEAFPKEHPLRKNLRVLLEDYGVTEELFY